MEDIKVSVFCLAYNHERYIKDALEGFVSQKTNFKYEVLINDDCSTDNTAKIIKEYEGKYPDIIKPIYQTNNQFSKGVIIEYEILLPLAKGQYIALCEGDDYWVDENKLQMQYDYMVGHPNCTFCFTDANVFECDSRQYVDFYKTYNTNKQLFIDNKEISIKEISHAILPTATFFYPKVNYLRFPKEYYLPCAGGDRKLELYSLYLGYGHYIDKKTVVYRRNVPNSATSVWKKIEGEKQYNLYKGFFDLYNNIDKLTNYRFHDDIIDDLRTYGIGMISLGINKGDLKNPDLMKLFKNESMIFKIKTKVKYNLPKLYHFYNTLRRGIKK